MRSRDRPSPGRWRAEMLRFIKLLTRSLFLLLIALFSALAAMRLAIHGGEVRVPEVKGMTTLRAQEMANASGLIVSIEDKSYNPEVPAGSVISQFPAPGARVRRGWRIRATESLGPPRASVPDLTGQTTLAATLNLRQRGLELGTVAGVFVNDVPTDQIVAQVPAANAAEVTSPLVNVLLAQSPPKPEYVMPNFVGRQLGEAKDKIAKAGLQIALVSAASETAGAQENLPSSSNTTIPASIPTSGIISAQSPPAGSRITADTPIRLQVER
jgi:eukaryotic-like serine/threonine-protein kinase